MLFNVYKNWHERKYLVHWQDCIPDYEFRGYVTEVIDWRGQIPQVLLYDIHTYLETRGSKYNKSRDKGYQQDNLLLNIFY